MSFMDLTRNELAYEFYTENRPKTPCENCPHAHVCWKVETVNAIDCTDSEPEPLKLKELLPLLRDEPYELVKGSWKNYRTILEYDSRDEGNFSRKELEAEVASISVTEIYLKEEEHEA